MMTIENLRPARELLPTLFMNWLESTCRKHPFNSTLPNIRVN